MTRKILLPQRAILAAAIMATMPEVHAVAEKLHRRRGFTRDNMMTFDARTIDSTGAFLVGELERLDQTIHDPLVDFTWSRDIDLRTDVSIADEASSFTNSTFAAVGGINPTGKAWIGKDSTQIANIALDIGKTAKPLYLWGMEVGYTIPELESAMRLGRPVDSQKVSGMQLKHQMDTDEMVYMGDSTLGQKGLVNDDSVITHALVENDGTGSATEWTTKTPDQILRDVNELLAATWEASGWAVVPERLLLPPSRYAYIVSQKVSTAGNMSIMEFLKQNSISLAKNGKPLEILPVKWLETAGEVADSEATKRMVAYTKDSRRVRYPMVPLQRTPLEYRSIYHLTTYFGRLGVVEKVYPETIQYRDGI